MTARRPSGAGQWRLVAGREMRERTRARSFRIGTALVAALGSALVVLPQLLPDGDDPEWTVAVAGTAPAGLEEAVDAGAAGSGRITLRTDDANLDPRSLLDDDEVDAVLVDGEELVVDERDLQLESILTGAVGQARLAERLVELGVDPADVGDAVSGGMLQIRSLDPAESDRAETREALAFFGVIGLFVAIASYGSWVLTSVLEEKANRVVEVVLSVVSPRQLLAGKVVGTGLVGLLQLAVVALVVFGVAAASGSLPDVELGTTAAALLVWFLLGFTFYAVGYAAAGSLVSRQEDAQSAVTPMVGIVMVAYFASLVLVVPDPTSTVARVVSLLPPVAPLAMPARTAAGAVEPWEVALAIVLMVVAIWLMITFAARVYTNAILRTGARVPIREALRIGTPRRDGGRASSET